MRIGHGYDVHRLVTGRKLILGGVDIPHAFGLLGHSDADVVTHALMDALLGAAALGDIGRHFPDTDPAYAGANSLGLLGHVMALLAQEGWRVENADVTILAQKPKLKDHIPQMVQNYARVMGLPVTAINVKATTEEGLGFTGTEQGIAAHRLYRHDQSIAEPLLLPRIHWCGRSFFMMVYLIMCRSLTYAQRVANALERGGIPARVLRSPEELSPAGCSYSVKIAQRNLARALTILHGARLPYLGIYVNSAGYGYQEVTP